MQKLAERLTEYILKQGIIEEEDFDIYKYGFQTGRTGGRKEAAVPDGQRR